MGEVNSSSEAGEWASAISDVRAVPLDQLWEDAGSRRLVARVTASLEEPAYVDVAMFSSGI